MQYRLDSLAAAAPLRPVQVMTLTPPRPVPLLRTVNGTNGVQGTDRDSNLDPPPDGGGGGAPSGSGNGNEPSGSGPPNWGVPGGNGPPGGPGGGPPANPPMRGVSFPPLPGGDPDGGRDPDPGGGPPGGPRFVSADDDGKRRKKKVIGTIELGKLPPISGFLIWRSSVRDEVSAAYENTQEAFAYVLALESSDATLDSMGQFSDDLTQLDAKLTKAINLMMTGLTTDLAKRLFNLKESFIKNGHKITGRQLMWVIYQFFAVDPSAGVLFGVEDLLDVTLTGNKLDEFLAEWDRTLIHMTDPPANALRDALFIKQVKGCPKLKTESDNYYKAPVGSDTRTFEYLHTSAMLVVERERFDHARKQITAKGPRDVMAVPGDNGKGKGKGKRAELAQANANGSPWYDTRKDQPCFAHAAGKCLLGNKCPFSHSKPGKGVPSAAAPAGGGAPTGKSLQPCHLWAADGTCRFGAHCAFSHDTPSRKATRPEKSAANPVKGDKKPNKSAGKKGVVIKKKKAGPGAVAEVVTSSEEETSESHSENELSSESEDD